jgi:hypothetical protein
MPIRLAPTIVDSRASRAQSLRALPTIDFVIDEHCNPMEIFGLQVGSFAAKDPFEVIEGHIWDLVRLVTHWVSTG